MASVSEPGISEVGRWGAAEVELRRVLEAHVPSGRGSRARRRALIMDGGQARAARRRGAHAVGRLLQEGLRYVGRSRSTAGLLGCRTLKDQRSLAYS